MNKEKFITCPLCDGDQVIEYDPHPPQANYIDDCQYCSGKGEVSYIFAEDRLHHYKVKKGLIAPW